MQLSVCIPTFNRASQLQALLERLLPQCTAENVEVIISDNASTDGTEEICRKACERFPFVRCIRQPENMGYAANVAATVLAASGDYSWLLSDDDRIHPQAVAQIARFLSKNAVAVALLNFARYERDNEAATVVPEFAVEKDLTGISLDSLLRIAGIWASFMSIAVISTKVAKHWCNVQALESNYAAFWLTLRVGTGGECGLLAEPLVFRAKGDWAKHRFLDWRTYLLDFARPINWATCQGSISRSTRRMLVGRMSRGFAAYVIVRTRLQGGSIRPLSEIAREHGGIPEFWIVMMPLLVLPVSVLRLGVTLISFAAKLTGHSKMAKLAENLVP